MRVEPFDPPLRFHVASRSGKADYLVDLGEYGGHGACTCGHWLCKLQPKVRDEGKRGVMFRCAHIKAAREFLAEAVVNKFLENEEARRLISVTF